MNIIHITCLSHNKASGVNRIVPYHVKWQSKHANILWYNISATYTPSMEQEPLYHGVDEFPSFNTIKETFGHPDLADLVVFHGVFFYDYIKIAETLQTDKIPYVVVPHGSLTRNALRKQAVQYLTKGECTASGIKWSKNYMVIPNGCDIPLNQRVKFRTCHLQGTFIGRKSIYYKGLDLLLDACSIIKPYLEKYSCSINIYGPSENGSNEILGAYIDKYELNDHVHLCEGVYENDKEEALLNSDFFILTSRTEGHPVALLEALSYGLPCLVTGGTNMGDDILQYKAGWVASADSESIAGAFLAMFKDIDRFSQFGSNARSLSLKYDWNKVAKGAIEQYRQVIQK